MKLELRKLKIAKNLSHETTAYTAELWGAGVLVAHLENSGTGGPDMAYYATPEARVAVDAFIASQSRYTSPHSGDPMPMTLEIYVGELINQVELQKQHIRWCKKSLVFKVKGDPEDMFRTLKAAYSPDAAAHVRNKYGDQLEYILNERLTA